MSSSSTTIMPLHSDHHEETSTPPIFTTESTKLATSHHRSSSSRLACQESYSLFKKCTMGGREVEGFSCGKAVASYMRCALDNSC
mmetsp:Transcript_27022/g.53990  ORF Transcript_27022/g.53990 Transcript_27022/m.53990 type:complete len:85 (-) Transcript_27022:2805-3059(-)